MKPADSGGADRVFLCKDEQELTTAFSSSMGSLGRQGRIIKEVVVQEFMQGTEYIVDTVSFQGHHRIVDIWKYNRVAVNGAQFVYDSKELVPCAGDIQDQLKDYTKKALDAVGLKNGPAHNEVMITASGPMLVEVNARLGGSMGPILNRECLGRGQLDFMMDVFFKPDLFLEEYQLPYEILRHGLAVYFISKDDEHVIDAGSIEQIKSLPSCYKLGIAAPGTRLAKTVDMFTMPGMAELVHRDSDQVWHDYHRIRQIEASGKFYSKPVVKRRCCFLTN
jgi:biotin carboxylase